MAGARRAGFTLIESVAALGIAGFLVLGVAATFLVSIRAERRALSSERLAAAAHRIVDDMAREARNGSLDYAAYGGTIPEEQVADLFLINAVGVGVSYALEKGSCAGSGNPCLVKLVNDPFALTQQNPAAVQVSSLAFYIQPSAKSTAPLITIVLELTDIDVPGAPTYLLQTSVTTRDTYDDYR